MEFKIWRHPGTGKKRVRAGAVKTLAIEHAPDNGAPTMLLDFEDSSVPAIDFGLAPASALQLFNMLMRPAEDFWKDARSIDLAAAPEGRSAIDCGEIQEVKVVVATATGIPTFIVEFNSAAPIPAVQFSLTPVQAMTLLRALMYLAETFGWLAALLQAAKPGGTKH